MKRYVMSHLPVALAYGLLVMAVKGTWLPLTITEVIRWGWWLVGVSTGVLILFLDRVAYTYAYPDEQLSQQFTYFVKNKQYSQAFAVLDARRSEQERLTFRSALFMTIWIPLSFFALSSTPALFGKGVVMGLMLHILYDGWRMQKEDPAALTRRLFWQVRRVFTNEEKMIFMLLISGFFVWFSFLVA